MPTAPLSEAAAPIDTALRERAQRVTPGGMTGDLNAAYLAMAAALAALTVADRDEGLIAHLQRMGSRLRRGIAEQAAAHGVKLRQSGPVQMPLTLFDDDPQYEKGIAFCTAALQRGVYLHPRHNMFLCGAHREKEIDRALEVTDQALRVVLQAC